MAPERRRPARAATRAAVALVAAVAGACASSSYAPQPRPPLPAPAPAEAPAPLAGLDGGQASRLVALARSLIGSPYRYAGRGPRGFDCSGLTGFVFGELGVALPRRAADQARLGSWVPGDELAPGDLVFFAEDGGEPHHVGLVVSVAGAPLVMVHASSSAGVVETEIFASSYWSRRLRFGRRLLE